MPKNKSPQNKKKFEIKMKIIFKIYDEYEKDRIYESTAYYFNFIKFNCMHKFCLNILKLLIS